MELVWKAESKNLLYQKYTRSIGLAIKYGASAVDLVSEMPSGTGQLPEESIPKHRRSYSTQSIIFYIKF